MSRKLKIKFIPDRRPLAILQMAVEISAVALAWALFDWKLALIVFLIFWARNLEVSNRPK